MNIDTKKCTVCSEIKSLVEFSKYSRSRDGYKRFCKECQKIEFQDYCRRNKELLKEKYDIYNKTGIAKERKRKYAKEHPEVALRALYKRRSKIKNGIVEKFTKQEIYDKDNGLCYLCEQQIDLSLKWTEPFSFTFEHVIPIYLGGYHTFENVRAAHRRCNQRKNRFI
jgi:5-methylcytosine-specific restriction endonuclease McrA